MAPAIVHFEIPSDNIERANKFYSDLFGWKMEKMPGPMEYWMFATSANSKGEQTISGGVIERKMSNEPITIYIGVNSVNDYAKKVEKLVARLSSPRLRSPATVGLQCAWIQRIIFSLYGRLLILNREIHMHNTTHTLTTTKHVQFAS
jgi:predicted enzyme related to lactoylglutathione lyase